MTKKTRFTEEDTRQLEELGEKLYHSLLESGLRTGSVSCAEDVMMTGVHALREAGELCYD